MADSERQAPAVDPARSRPGREAESAGDGAPEAHPGSPDSDARLFAVLDLVPAIVFVKDLEGRYRFMNRRFEAMLGVDRNAARGRRDHELFPREIADQFVANDGHVQATGQTLTTEEVAVHDDGSTHSAIVVKFLLRDAQGRPEGVCGMATDITERKDMERRLRTSLREKEVLLREVNHRVRNNLQVISSLLNLQEQRLTEPSARAALAEARGRVQSMALVHETLYRARDLSRVHFDEYVRALVDNLLDGHAAAARGISAQVVITVPGLGVDAAIPCGLVINELVTNALKHAFPAGRGGLVSISLRDAGGGDVELRVADDGVGLPPDVDPARARSLGLDLVFTFAEQLDARVEVDRAPGTAFRLTFPHGVSEHAGG
jgi:PAS domain S-box-containing protein